MRNNDVNNYIIYVSNNHVLISSASYNLSSIQVQSFAKKAEKLFIIQGRAVENKVFIECLTLLNL